MASPFLITGLPRSRTHWLANFMDTGQVNCFHDLSRSVASVEDYFSRIEKPLTGVCDTGLLLVPGATNRYANHPTLSFPW